MTPLIKKWLRETPMAIFRHWRFPYHDVSLPTAVKAAPLAHRFAAAALTAVGREETATKGG